MKKLNLLTVAVLASTMVGGVVASAADPGKGPTDLNTKAKVVFEANESEGPNTEVPEGPGGETVDPGNPGGEIPSEKAPLMITYAPNFDFGKIKLDTKDLTKTAENLGKTTDGKYLTHFVQVKDARATHEGWNLTAKATPLTMGSEELNGGSTIKFSNFTVKGEEGVTPATAQLKEITFNGKESKVMSAAVNSGEGTTSGIMGTGTTQEQDENAGVTLNVTKADAIKASVGEYTLTITWNLAGTPAYSAAATPQA